VALATLLVSEDSLVDMYVGGEPKMPIAEKGLYLNTKKKFAREFAKKQE
jgi:hypothetical protein